MCHRTVYGILASMYTVYILECADGTLYTGITTDTARRLELHRAGVASRYTAAKGAVAFRYTETHPDRSSASKREAAIKKLTRGEKQALISNASS